MGSIIRCIGLSKISDKIAEKITARQKEYIKTSTIKEANIKAVQTVLQDVKDQHSDVVEQINDQLKKNYKDIIPKDEHPGIDAVRQKLNENVKEGEPEEKVTQVDNTSPTAKTLEKIAKKFKKKLVFFKTEGKKTTNGFMFPSDPDTIYINVKHPKAALFVFGHELVHSLKAANHSLYLKMFEALHPQIDNFDTFYEQENQRRTKQGLNTLEPAQMAEEFFSDFSGEQFTDEKFWQKLMNKDPKLFGKVAELFKRLFNKIKAIGSEDYFRDINASQDALLKVLDDYENQLNNGGVNDQVTEKTPTNKKIETKSEKGTAQTETPKLSSNDLNFAQKVDKEERDKLLGRNGYQNIMKADNMLEANEQNEKLLEKRKKALAKEEVKHLQNISIIPSAEAKKALNIKVDIPSQRWLDSQREYALMKDSDKGIYHGSTTSMARDVMISPDELLNVKGMNGEHDYIGNNDDRVKKLAEDIEKNGFNPESKPFINVSATGEARINEGNHRIRAAKLAGVDKIPVWISWFAGGELIPGKFHPDTLIKNPDIKFSTNSIAEREGLLRPATITDGVVRINDIGDTHFEKGTPLLKKSPIENGVGFLTPEGRFLNRKQALVWVEKNRPEAYKALDKTTRKNGLESIAYARAEGYSGETDKAADDYLKSLGVKFSDKPLTPEEVVKEVFTDKGTAADTITRRAIDAIKFRSLGEFGNKMKTLRKAMVDQYQPINEKLGSTIYELHRMLNNSSATIGTFLQHGKMSWDNGAITVKSKDEGFVPWLHSMGKEGHKFLYWVAAKRAELLDEQDRENWFTADKRKVILDDVEKRGMTKQYEKWNEKLQEFNNNVLDIAQEAGLIDKASRKNWMSHYYLPFFRLLEDENTGEEFIKGPTSSRKYIRSGIRTLKGGEAAIGDPIQNIVQNWTHLITMSQHQMAMSSAGELMGSLGLGTKMTAGQLTKVLGVTSKYGVRGLLPDGKISWKPYEGMNKTEVQTAIKDNPDASLIEKQVINTAPDMKKAAHVISFMREGKSVYMRVEDPELFRALTHARSDIMKNPFIMSAGVAKRLLTGGATFGAAFRIANTLRDTLQTSIASPHFIPFIDSFKGAVQVFRKSPDYIALMASGGGFSQGYLNSADPQALSRSINKIIKNEGKGAVTHILDTPKKMLGFWEELGHASEMAARVQLYTNLKAAGKTHLEAAFEARDIMDFAASGDSEVLRTLTAVTPFLNARMQGLDRVARGARDNPVAFLVKGGILAAASLALWARYKDDDRYKGLEDWDKWQYYHFWVGDTHYRIPKPFEVGSIFSTLFESAAESMSKEEDFKYFLDMMAFTVHNTFAVGLPAIGAPLLDVAANKSFFTGRKLEPSWMENLKPGVRAQPWTSESLKEIGEKLNISPMKMKSLIRGYTATYGTALLTVADAMLEAKDDVKTPEKHFHEYLGLNRFFKKSPSSTKYATRYYEFATDVTEVVNTIANYQKMGDYKKAKDMAANHSGYQARAWFVNSTNQMLSAIRKQERYIWANKSLSREMKRSRLERLRKRKNEIYKRAYQQVKDRFSE